METVCCGKQWDVILLRNEQGAVSAALPYLIGSKLGLRYILQPQLTQYNGPWYRPGTNIPSATQQLMAELKKLRLSLYRQCFAPGTPNLEAWQGYERLPRITYRIEDISDPEAVFRNFDKRHRKTPIRSAAKVLHPADITPEAFADLHAHYWRSRGQKDLLPHDFMVRLITAALQHGQGLLAAVADESGTIHAARFVVFDSNCAYSLLSALGEEHHNGASPYLFWLILQQLAAKTRAFDFEGSMTPSIAHAYSLYGSTPTTFYQLTRCKNPIIRRIIH